jgi:hypothetical protein
MVLTLNLTPKDVELCIVRHFTRVDRSLGNRWFEEAIEVNLLLLRDLIGALLFSWVGATECRAIFVFFEDAEAHVGSHLLSFVFALAVEELTSSLLWTFQKL